MSTFKEVSLQWFWHVVLLVLVDLVGPPLSQPKVIIRLELFGLAKLKALVLEPVGRQAEADRRLEEAAKRIPKDGKPLSALGEFLAPAAEARAKKPQDAA